MSPLRGSNPCSAPIHENQDEQKQRNIPQYKQYKLTTSILIFKLRLGEFSAEHLLKHPPPLPLSSLAKDEVESTWGMDPFELLYRIPLGVS